MKKIFATIFVLFFGLSALAVDSPLYQPPVPSDYDDYGYAPKYEQKYTTVSELRYQAFQNAVVSIDKDVFAGKEKLNLYSLSTDGKKLKKNKIPNAKICEYTNNTYSVVYKNQIEYTFWYDSNFNLTEIAMRTNQKTPAFRYYYNTEGKIQAVEVIPDNYYSYVYALNGLLIKYYDYGYCYDSKRELIYKKKGS